MKRKFLCFIATLLALLNGISFIGCDLPNDPYDSSSGNSSAEGEIPLIDNQVDLKEFTPAPNDDYPYIEGETYYQSNSVDLVTEINGNYTTDKPFTLDPENDKKRIYHNIYFYKEDFFQILYYKKFGDLGSLYVIMSDENDQEYAEIEYTPQGSPLQVNIKEQGIYNLILDIETFGIDMVKVGEIDTPVYETIKTCELYVHLSADNYTYSPMTLDTATNEYYMQAEIPSNASLGFFSASHNSRYKMTVDTGLNNTLAYWDFVNPTSVRVHVGGTYKVYFHAKTYVLRLELQNPDTANYYCQVGWNQGNVLTPKSDSEPYLFEYNFDAQGTPTDPYVELPSFYPELGLSYALSIVDEDGFVFADSYVTESGTYKLTVNLKDLTLTVKKLA